MEEGKAMSDSCRARRRIQRRRRFTTIAIALVVAYLTGYVGLRATHRITHFSNAEHWHPEKRSPGHSVSEGGFRTPALVLAPFKPLMLAEEALRNAAARMGG